MKDLAKEQPFTFFDLDTFLTELHAELRTYGVADRVIKRSITHALAAAVEEGEE